jgi:exonuclease SbcD
VRLDTPHGANERLLAALPTLADLEGAITRLTVDYRQEWEAVIDETALRQRAEKAFEFHLIRRPQVELRIRLPENQSIGSLTPFDLLDLYWNANHIDAEEKDALARLAGEIIQDDSENQSI